MPPAAFEQLSADLSQLFLCGSKKMGIEINKIKQE